MGQSNCAYREFVAAAPHDGPALGLRNQLPEVSEERVEVQSGGERLSRLECGLKMLAAGH